jgi:cell wall-associated NlpC family hydrolase
VAIGFLGAPYRLGGSGLKGIDCSAFVRKTYQIFDIDLPRNAGTQSKVGMSIDHEELVEGDLVFFRTRRPLGHVGIYIGNN